MTTLAVRAPSETSRCPRCAYHHSGPKGQLCPTCVALAGGAATFTCYNTVHATQPQVVAPSPTPATDAHQPAPESPALPAAPPAPYHQRRHAREPRMCAYASCGQMFTPKKATQRFHTLRCSARWRVAQDGGTQLRRAATRPRHTTRPGPDLFVVQVRDELAVIEALVTVLHTRLQGQQALLEKHQRQAACLRQYLALTEEPSP